MQKGEKETLVDRRKEGTRTMFGGGGMLTMGNCLTAIFLLSAVLVQTRARYEKIFLFISKIEGYKEET